MNISRLAYFTTKEMLHSWDFLQTYLNVSRLGFATKEMLHSRDSLVNLAKLTKTIGTITDFWHCIR